jgi:hypothetical protein
MLLEIIKDIPVIYLTAQPLRGQFKPWLNQRFTRQAKTVAYQSR